MGRPKLHILKRGRVKCGSFSKMAVEFGKILPLLLIPFLASTSLGQNLSEVTTNPSKSFPEIPESPHENFNVSFYHKAQNYTETHWREMTVEDANTFSQYSLHMENGIRQKMAEFAGNPNLSFEEMTKIIQDKIDDGGITSAEISTLQKHTLATQEAYVKKVIKIFDLRPEDFNTTSEYFCEVFEFCNFFPTPTPSTTSESSTAENSPKITTITTKTSSTTEEIKPESISPTENPPTSSSEKTVTQVSDRRSDDLIHHKIEEMPGDEISTTEKSDAVTPNIVDSTEEMEPEVEPVKTKPETVAKKGSSRHSLDSGSGSSRTSQFASTMLLCSIILTLSNFL